MSKGIQYSYNGTKRIEFLLILRLLAEGKTIRNTAEISEVSAPSILKIKHKYADDIDKLKIKQQLWLHESYIVMHKKYTISLTDSKTNISNRVHDLI